MAMTNEAFEAPVSCELLRDFCPGETIVLGRKLRWMRGSRIL